MSQTLKFLLEIEDIMSYKLRGAEPSKSLSAYSLKASLSAMIWGCIGEHGNMGNQRIWEESNNAV